MYSVSAAYQSAVEAEHTVAWRLETLYGGTVTGTFDRVIDAGSVSVSKSAQIRRTVRGLQVIDRDGTLGPKLGVVGQEVRPYRGIVVGGTPEYVPVGTFWLTGVENPQADGIVWNLQGMDRGGVIDSRRFYDPYVVPSGSNYGAEIQTLLRRKLPSLTYTPTDFSTLTARLTPSLVFEAQNSPWGAVQSMARSVGMELFIDPAGICVMRPEPDPTESPIVRTYSETASRPGLRLIKFDIELSNEATYNGVVVTGESTGLAAPVRGDAWDSDASSPTYRYGPFGEVPLFHFSPLAQTAAQATETAAAMLQAQLGLAEQVNFAVVCDPALDASDILRFVQGTIDDIYVIDSLEVPLDPESPLRGTCRKRRSAA